MMKKIVIQIYEVQDPAEARALIALGVDHIGSVIVSESDWKISAVKDTIRNVKGAGAKSSLIPLFNHPDSVFRTLEYYQPDMVHFCEALVDQMGDAQNCRHLIRLQEQVKKRFPDTLIMRSIPIVQQGSLSPVDTLEISRRRKCKCVFFEECY